MSEVSSVLLSRILVIQPSSLSFLKKHVESVYLMNPNQNKNQRTNIGTLYDCCKGIFPFIEAVCLIFICKHFSTFFANACDEEELMSMEPQSLCSEGVC